jgi:tetratricopeptide (TPR) repeat protein
LYFSKNDWANALGYYKQASDMDPSNPHTLLALARTNQELQDYAGAKDCYIKLKKVNPTLADQFAYLGQSSESGTRAADVQSERTQIIWESEE